MDDSESDSSMNMNPTDDVCCIIEDSQIDSSTTIMDLPDDCLVRIFKRLRDNFDREFFGLTCSRWLEIQNRNRKSLRFDPQFSYTIQISGTLPSIDTYDLHRALSRFQYLRSLCLSGCTEIPDSGLELLQCFGSCLRALVLDCCMMITDNGLSFVASGCPLLMYISLYYCKVTDVGLEILAKSCPGLEDVNLVHCLRITDRGISVLVQNCHRLYGIRISNCRGIEGVGFQGCSPTLAYIEAESCKLEPEGLASVVSGGGLEYLNVSNLCWTVRGDGSAIGGGFARMLRVLNMRLCRIITDEGVAVIAKGCPSLVEWNLALCPEIRVAGWESIALNCHNLEKLHVNRCRNLCDRGLEALKNGCKKLTFLYMNGCPQITSLAIELFRLSRGDSIKDEERLTIGPKWQFWWRRRIFVD